MTNRLVSGSWKTVKWQVAHFWSAQVLLEIGMQQFLKFISQPADLTVVLSISIDWFIAMLIGAEFIAMLLPIEALDILQAGILTAAKPCRGMLTASAIVTSNLIQRFIFLV